MSVLSLEFEGKSYNIDPLPNSFDSLKAKAKELLQIVSFKVYIETFEIESTRDLMVAYLNCNQEELVLVVHESVQPISYVSASLDSLISELAGPSQLTVDSLLSLKVVEQLLDEIEVVTKRLSIGVSNRFQDVRLRFYKTDAEQYRAVVYEQLSSLSLLQTNILREVLRKHSIDPVLFEKSLTSHSFDLNKRLENREEGPVSDTLPADLDKAKFREMLEYSTNFTLGYLAERGVVDHMEYAMLKVIEADEMFLVFGYRESQINLAFKEFDFEGSSEWDDIKLSLEQVKLTQI